jgi:tetratricopeptide (TPR) repeat protein
LPQSQEQARQASQVINWLTKVEPQNTEWMQAGALANFDRAGLELGSFQLTDAKSAASAACDSTERLIARDRSVSAWRDLQLRCLRTRVRIAIRERDADAAVALARQGLVMARSEKNEVDRAFAIAGAEFALGEALARASQPDAARGAYERALAAWPKNVEERPSELADHAILLRRLGQQAEASRLAQRLAEMGYRHPDYLNGRQQG